jgi:hypothetical protein
MLKILIEYNRQDLIELLANFAANNITNIDKEKCREH